MKFGACFQRLFYNLHFELTKSKYIRFSEIVGMLLFLLIPTKSCSTLIRTFPFSTENDPAKCNWGLGMTASDAMG